VGRIKPFSGVLDTVDRWLDHASSTSAEMWLGERSYTIERWAPAGHDREALHAHGAYRKGFPVGEAGPSDAAVEVWEGEGGR
jgi:hypothetical protein